MKYYLSLFENVFEQLDAMQEVAPVDFTINFDLTMGGTNEHIPDLLDKMARYPICGSFEDPLNDKHIEDYVHLQRRAPLPIIFHHSPLGFTYEVLRGAEDGYIIGTRKSTTLFGMPESLLPPMHLLCSKTQVEISLER